MLLQSMTSIHSFQKISIFFFKKYYNLQILSIEVIWLVAVQYFILSIVQILKKNEHNLLVNALDLILKISLKVCLFLSKKKTSTKS